MSLNPSVERRQGLTCRFGKSQDDLKRTRHVSVSSASGQTGRQYQYRSPKARVHLSFAVVSSVASEKLQHTSTLMSPCQKNQRRSPPRYHAALHQYLSERPHRSQPIDPRNGYQSSDGNPPGGDTRHVHFNDMQERETSLINPCTMLSQDSCSRAFPPYQRTRTHGSENVWH